MLAIIGGSGLASLPGLEAVRRKKVRTAYGAPSAPLTFGRMSGRGLVFLARHGDRHTIAPHQINYRANIRALADAGAKEVVAVATVGGIRKDCGPGSLVLPDQIIDYTWGRASTFYGGRAGVTHVDFTRPYSAPLRTRLLAAARACGEALADGGVYGATQGPRLESAAEITRMERDGADLVGMTGMPEAALAREAELEYATLAVVVNHAAGKGDSLRSISTKGMEEVIKGAMARVRKILVELCKA